MPLKTVFEKETREELIRRINAINSQSKSNWGRMNVYQMVGHCNIWEAWIAGKNGRSYKQMFLGKLFGKMVLKSSLKDDKPISRNSPAGSDFLIKEKETDLDQQKKQWIEHISAYEYYSNPKFIHDFFGKMTVEQIGQFAYKHNDHHLRQFGV